VLSTVIASTSIVVISLLFGAALLVAWRNFELDRHVALWALSFISAAVGHGLRTGGGIWLARQELFAMLACHASVASFAFLAWGFRRRAQRGSKLVFGLWAVSIVLLGVFLIGHGIEWRTISRIVTGLADAAMVGIIVATLGRTRGAWRVAQWNLALYGLYAAGVGLAAWLARPGGEISNQAFIAILLIGTPTGMIGTGILTLLIVSADLARELRKQARTDALTGLLNRRGIEERAAILLQRSSLTHPLIVVIADLDHFKIVNDRFGHAAGDEALRRFAGHLRASIHTQDVAGRLGGEEFLLLLPDTNAQNAEQLVDAIRAGVPNALGGVHVSHRVTASFGMTIAQNGVSFSEALARADEALYHSKQSGRDRISFLAVAVS